MSRIPTETEIQKEMTAIGGNNDFFAAKAKLEHRYAEAERALEKLKPVVSETDSPWRIEPSELEIDAEMSRGAGSRESGRALAAKRLSADAIRLATVSTSASAEISEALELAEAARAKAASLLEEHEAVLNAVTSGIIAVGKLRKKIAAAKSLSLDAAGERKLAKTALDFWVDQKTTSATNQNVTGFRSFCEDLSWRLSLTKHIADFVQPLEKQAETLIASIRSQAKDAKMDLRKLMTMLAAERGQRGGESLLHESDFYGGIL